MQQRTVRPGSEDLEVFRRMLKETPVSLIAINEGSTIKSLTFFFENVRYEIRFSYSDSIVRYLPDPEPETYWVKGKLAGEDFEKQFDTRRAAEKFVDALGLETLEIVTKGGEEAEQEILF